MSSKGRFWENAAFALPAAPMMALTLPPLIYLPPYYAEHLGLPLALVGAVFFAARMLDVAIDPAIGAAQDRTINRFGRRRLWMALGAPPLLAAIWFAFLGIAPGAPFAALVAGVFLLQVANSNQFIAHLGWAQELRPEYHARTRLLGHVQVASVAGQVAILVLPAVIQLSGAGDFAAGVRAMGWALMLAFPLTLLIAFATVGEPPRAPEPAVGWKASWAALRGNADLQRALLSDYLIGVTQGLTGGLFVLLFRHVLQQGDFSEVLLLIYFVASLAGVPIWVRLAARYGKKRALQIGLAWMAAGFLLLPFIPPAWKPLVLAGVVFSGLAQSASILLVRSMMADLVDEDDVRCGRPRAGLFFGLQSTTLKVGIATGPLAYLVLASAGFDAQLGAGNSPGAIAALVAMFSLAPAVLLLLAALALRRYGLSEVRHRELRAIIEARPAPEAVGVEVVSASPRAPA